MRNSLRISTLLGMFLFTCSRTRAQDAQPDCRSMTYENRNQIDVALHIASLSGFAKDAERFPIWSGCVGVFSESGHKLLASTAIDPDGSFHLDGLAKGRYRLVITSPGFCPANATIVLKNRHGGKKHLAATMKPSAIDVCSFIEWR
jgi:hypothetical protein